MIERNFYFDLFQFAIVFLIRVPMVNRDWLVLYKKERGIECRLDYGHFIEYTLESFENEISVVGLDIKEYSIQFGEIWAECKARNTWF